MNLTGSLYKLLSEKFGIVLARSEQNIRAVNLSREVSRQLKVKEGSAGLFMQSLTFDDGNVPVEMLYSYYRGDKYVFEIEVGTYHLQDEAL
jgi:GntR family transcriptional regulator